MMYSFCNADGYFVGGVFCGDEIHLKANTPAGCTAVPGRHDPLCRRVDLETGEVIPYQPEPPADTDMTTWAWDEASERWQSVPTLAALKSQAWVRIKAARDAVEFAPFEYNGMMFDGDEVAQRRLGPTIRRAQAAIYANAPFEQAWKLADNTMVTLAAADFIAIEAAKVDQFNDAFFRAEALLAQINAAQTAEELDLITWS